MLAAAVVGQLACSRDTVANAAPSTPGVPEERDPLVLGMTPSTVTASESFQLARNHTVVLNTQVLQEIVVQNRFDKAVLEMFNVLKHNEPMLASGEFSSYILNGNIPVGGDLEAFGALLADTKVPFPITSMHYPGGASSGWEGQWGTFDARKGLQIRFVEEPGLVTVTQSPYAHIFGLTPRLSEENGLLLDIFVQHESPPPDYPNRENVDSIATTWIASNMMQIMTLGYGQANYDYLVAPAQHDLMFRPPYGMNETIASLMSGRPPGGNHADYSNVRGTWLLDYSPLE